MNPEEREGIDMPEFNVEVSVMVTVAGSITARDQSRAEYIARGIYANADTPEEMDVSDEDCRVRVVFISEAEDGA